MNPCGFYALLKVSLRNYQNRWIRQSNESFQAEEGMHRNGHRLLAPLSIPGVEGRN